MIRPDDFVAALRAKGASLFVGVPDSLLKELSLVMQDVLPQGQHIIAANEGNALAISMGHYLASNKPAVVYLQNSGLGNLINPLISLADPVVYSIPALLLIGWRGEPGLHDEPQHLRQGELTINLLDQLEIPYKVVDCSCDFEEIVDTAWNDMEARNAPVALLVKRGSFSDAGIVISEAKSEGNIRNSSLIREEVIRKILELSNAEDCFIATTGITGRELFGLRASRGEAPKDFLTIGGMGHCSSIALGVAISKPKTRVICLDGDGALLMHMGSVPVIGDFHPGNLVHVLLNNGAHESVGGQPTAAHSINFCQLAISCGYANIFRVNDLASLEAAWFEIQQSKGPSFVEVLIIKGSRPGLGRPSIAPKANKEAFMRHLGALV